MPDFLTENENEVIRNIHPGEHFVPDSFEITPYPMGIQLVIGQLKDEHMVQQMINPGKKTVQGVKFEKPTWTMDQALEWLKENQRYFNSLDEIDKRMYNKEMNKIDAVQIFSAGTWNGDTYTVEDLNEMVRAFNEQGQFVSPYLKLGHSEDQKLLKADGLPSAGSISKLYVKGQKLYADFVDIPSKIYDIIVKKGYKKVSSEIMIGVKILDKTYKFMVSAVALLGADTPGVMNLDDILALYGLNKDSTIKSYDHKCEFDSRKEYELIEGDPMPKSEKELELEMKAKLNETELAELKAKVEKFEASEVKNKKTIESLEAEKKDSEKKAFDAAAELAKVSIEKDADQLIAEDLMPKSAKEFAMALLGPEKKNYSFGEDKEMTKLEVIKEIFKVFKATSDVNLDESSEDVEQKKTKTTENLIDEEVMKYSKDNDVTYTEAYKVIAPKYAEADSE